MSNKGKILLVGFGPGAKEHMSLRARQAITESDVVIGYATYIKLVQDLLDGKEVIRKGMTEEIDRCTLPDQFVYLVFIQVTAGNDLRLLETRIIE